MLTLELTPAEESIVRHLCELQIESFTRLKEKDSSVEVDERLADADVKPEDFLEIVNGELAKYHRVIESPSMMFTMERILFSTLKEITLNYEEELAELFGEDLSGFWKKLFLAEYVWGNMN